MNLLIWLIPWTLSAQANEIYMGAHEPPIKAERIELTDGREPLMAFSVRDYVKLKRRAESASGYCTSATEAASEAAKLECEQAIEAVIQRERISQVDQVQLIDALKLELKLSQQALIEEQSFSNTVKWISIGTGAAALATTLTLILRR